MASEGGDKTEAPTPKRKKEAREKGNIPKTPELATWTTVLATLVLLKISFDLGYRQMSGILQDMGELIANPDAGKLVGFLVQGLIAVGVIVAPLALGILFVGVTMEIAQTGMPSMKRLKPDFKRLNPIKGLKQMATPKTLWELFKSIAKVGVLLAVSWPILSAAFYKLLEGGLALDQILGIVGETAFSMIRNVGMAGLCIAAADYSYQRYRIGKELKMSKQEIRDENRNSEGDQMVKQQIRQRARAMSQNRMIASVGEADVVLVNPTHYAVALRYTAERGAPEVIAKGKGFIALRIREQAAAAGVPVVADPPLARTLHSLCEVGRLIPPDLYEAVARILAYVMGVKRRGLVGGVLELPTSVHG